MKLSEKTLLKVLDTMPGIVFWKSADLRYGGANKKFLRLVGLTTLDELIGKKDADMDWPKHYKDYFKKHDPNIVNKGKPIFSIQKNILAADGNVITLVTDKYPIYGDDHTITGILGISNTIFDPEISSQTYLQNIIEIIPYYVFWKNANLEYLGCNNKFANLVKKSPKEIIGKTDFDLQWGAGEAEGYQLGDRKTMSGNPTINAEEILLRPDGSKIIMLVNKVPLLDKLGQCIGVLGTSTDITEVRNTQFKLKEAEERLAGIRALSASIAHELRTPLAAIQFGISGMKDYLPLLVDAYKVAKKHKLNVEPIQSEHLQILTNVFNNIQSEVRYSETIINMILMNVKQSNVSTVDFKIYSMNECIKEAMYRYPFKPHEESLIKLNNKKDFLFHGDKTLMMHVLFNLFKNSLYYIQAAKKGKIEIKYSENENNNVLYFKDTGQGIPDEVLPRLFEKFYSTTYHGTGLGLAFCKMIITSFGGNITCTSKYGEFTQFEMTFPKHQETI